MLRRALPVLLVLSLAAAFGCKERMERAKREFEALPPEYAGKLVFGRLCVTCHGVGEPYRKEAPDLLGVMDRRDEAWVRAYLENPQAVAPGSRMPRYALDPVERDRVVAFLKGLPGSLQATRPPEAPAR